MPLPSGTRLGRYEVRSQIGAGGMGEVYLARDTTELEREVAVKVLPAEMAADPERMRRFVQEAKTASSLNHPNILTIHEIGEVDSSRFIVTEYVEGETLRQKMGRSRITLREALDIATQIASSLVAAHRAGVVHRDIKPENVMLRGDGIVKVLDFGIAKLAEQRPQAGADTEAPTRALVNTGPGTVLGTVAYMSPEQARGLEVDERTDIWSLGVLLYEMVAGRVPFEGETATDILAVILHREPASLLLHRKDVPDELERIVEKALTKDREERYQLAKELGVDLKRLRQHLDLEAEMERSVTPERSAEERRAATGGGHAAAATDQLAAARTGGGGDAHTTSSAEYVVTEIRRHRRGALLALAALLMLTFAVGYFAYSRYSARGGEGVRSVAVLPFANEGGNPEAEYLSDGLSESLINALSRLPQLKVIARSSSFRYKGQEVDVREAAKALGVEAVVTGRVTQRGEQLQVSVEMVNAGEGTQMWGEQYTRQAADLQTVQAEISKEIAEKLRLRLTGAQEERLAKRATENPEAYQLYLNGLFYLRKGGFENTRKGLDYYSQAVALDPQFALAWAGVAASYRYFAANSVLDPKEAMPKAKAAAEKALELDEGLADAHLELANIKHHEWDWAGAGREYRRAIELNTNLAAARANYGTYLSFMGRHAEALAEVKRAQDLDPLQVSARGREGQVLYFARRYDEAIQQFQNVLKIDPGDSFTHAYLGYTYAAKGMYGEAVEALRKSISIEGENTSDLCYLGHALARSGQRGEAQAILDRLKGSKEYVSPAELAVIQAGLGDKEGALLSLERAFAAHDLQLQFLKVDPHFDGLRPEPRFQDVVRKVGLPQ